MTNSQPSAVFITGAAKRVGAAITRRLHEAGCNVVIHCNRSRRDADELAGELNGVRAKSAAVLQGDLLAYNALKGLVDQAASAFGRLDGLVNNASAFYATPIGTIDEDSWSPLIDANLKAPLFLSQAAAVYLRKTRGSIVNIVDIHSERPLKDFVVYNVTKAGVIALAESGLYAEDLDLIIVATATPDSPVPNTACRTDSFAKKPITGGIPANENISSNMTNANHGLR